jgi:tripartite motif-containing protein 71
MLIASLLALIVFFGVLFALLLMRGRDEVPPPSLTAGPQTLLIVTGPGKGPTPDFNRPLAAAWGPDGEILVSDTDNSRVCVFDRNGRFIREFGGPKIAKSGQRQPGGLIQPVGLASSPDGRVYVADLRAGEVVVYDKAGKRRSGIAPERMASTQGAWAPTDVALANNRLYVTDGADVTVFSLEGSATRRFDGAGPGSPFAHPNGVAVRSDGTVFVSDTNNTRVVALEASGSPRWTIGPDAGGRRVVGLPRGIAVAENGTVLVADAFLFGVTTLTPDGAFLSTWGARGSGAGEFAYPNDVDVRGDLVLIADKENNRVQVARFPGLLGGPK